MAFWTRSIRVRLTFSYTLLVLSTLTLFGALSYYFTSKTLSENLDISLKNEVRWVRDFIAPQASKVKPSKRSIDNLLARRVQEPLAALRKADADSIVEEADEIWNQIFRHTLHSPKKTYIQLSDTRGTVLYRSLNLATDSLIITDTISTGSILVTTGYLNGEPLRVAALGDRNFNYLVGYPLAELRDLLENLYFIFLLLVPIALAVSIFGGLALAHKSLQPVDEIASRARRITVENLDQELPVPEVNDEIGRLTGTINDMIRRLHESFAQMRQLSAEASHELRTPLTVMRGEIELALRTTQAPGEYRNVLESSLEEILRMTSIIDNLLLLAKAEQGNLDVHFSEVDLKELVDELFEDSEVLAEQKRIAVCL
jgi:signal transduction histidine kinase